MNLEKLPTVKNILDYLRKTIIKTKYKNTGGN
jgi:hypothetical protein